MSILAGLFAAGLILLVLQDAFEVMLLPRRVQRRVRFMSTYFRVTWGTWSAFARRLPCGQRREAFLSYFGALSMLGLFFLWAAALIIGFGILQWSLQIDLTGVPRSSLAEQTYMSGVTFFTLGYGEVVPHSAAGRFIAILEAGTGIGFIAVVIGYLPVLYQLFARREAHVIQLDARAGSPPTAVTMLCRHAEAGGLTKLDYFLREWEVWGSELLESHLSYPMLAYYRSQHDDQSWLAAVAAVMDCCALILVGVRELQPLQARMTFGIARQVVVEMARSFGIEPIRNSGSDRLPHAAYVVLEGTFARANLEWDTGQETEATLVALRATYEPLLHGLASHLMLPLPGWMPNADAVEHWEGGHRGLIARQLVEQLTDPTHSTAVTGSDRQESSWRRLRRRLRRD